MKFGDQRLSFNSDFFLKFIRFFGASFFAQKLAKSLYPYDDSSFLSLSVFDLLVGRMPSSLLSNVVAGIITIFCSEYPYIMYPLSYASQFDPVCVAVRREKAPAFAEMYKFVSLYK